MGTIFMNSGNSKIYDSYRLLLNLSDKTNLKKGKYQILTSAIHGKI